MKKIQLIIIAALFAFTVSSVKTVEGATEKLEIGSKGYHVGNYGDGAYWVSDGLYNSIFIVSDEGVIVIDAPPSYANKLPDAIREITDQTVKYFIYSHHHKDHTGGASLFGDDVIYVGHELAAQELRRKKDVNRPVPTVTFSDSHTVKLGKQQVKLVYPGLQHSPGNVFIYLPKQKVLMLVDVIYPGWVPFENLAVAASVPGFFRAFDQAKEFDFDYFQGGHVDKPGTREDFEDTHQYIIDLQANALKALQSVKPPLSFTGQDNPTKEPYMPINAFLNASTEVCTQLMLEKWEDNLNAASLYTKGHCRTTLIDLMID